MRLWIDGQCLQTTSRLRGIGRYVIELIRAIGETRPEVEMAISFNATLAATVPEARASVGRWIAAPNIHMWQSAGGSAETRSGYDAWHRLSEVALAHHVACLSPDVALSASPFEGQSDLAAPLLTRAGHDFPWAAIFFDAIPHRYPARYLAHPGSAAAYERRLAVQGEFDLLLAISGFAKHEALATHPGAKVVQIDAGVSSEFLDLARQPANPAVVEGLDIRKPFLLYVGALDWRKNVTGAVAGFARLPRPLRDRLQFVLAGDVHSADLEKVRALWTQVGLEEGQLRVLGHVDDALLVQLYRHTDLVLQPSFMEGFGLTALEAMHCGAPVIAADAGALPEVVGDARALFDPHQPAAIAARMEEFLSNTTLTRAMIAHGVEQARAFSWERTAGLAVDALEQLARSTPAVRPRAELRRITLGHLDRELRARDRTAQTLAAAEPPLL